jgi:hypothetical protein
MLRRLGSLDAKLSEALADVHDWFGLEAPGDSRRAAELKKTCVAATPSIGPQSSWADLVTVNLIVRVTRLRAAWKILDSHSTLFSMFTG